MSGELAATAVWLAVLIVLGIMFVVVLRRVSALVARTRELEAFQRAIAGVDATLAAVADPMIGALDGLVRLRTGDAGQVSELLPLAAATLRDTADRARRIDVPAGLTAEAASIVRELDRAARSAEVAKHGLETYLARGSDRKGEAGVDLKRGALNLRHARDAVRSQSARIAALTPAELVARSDSPWARGPAAHAIYVAEGTDDDVDEGFEPRM